MQPISIRTFIGAKDFDLCRQFYSDLGFEEVPLGDMSFFRLGAFGFYLQKAYVKDWVHNSMIFLEVEDVEQSLEEIKALNLPAKYKGVRLSEIVVNDWGKEFFLHDPSGVLWHVGNFE
ncbi:MAG: glyoxalase [Cyclobacteriaceae bacterium]